MGGAEERRKEKFRLILYSKGAKQRRGMSHHVWGKTGENGPEEEILKQKVEPEKVCEQGT